MLHLKFQHRNQIQHLSIEYLDKENNIEFINDNKLKEQLLLDTYSIQLSQNVGLIDEKKIYFDRR